MLGTCTRLAAWPGIGDGCCANVDMLRGRALTAAPIIGLPAPPPLLVERTGGGVEGRGALMDALAMERRERTRSSG